MPPGVSVISRYEPIENLHVPGFKWHQKWACPPRCMLDRSVDQPTEWTVANVAYVGTISPLYRYPCTGERRFTNLQISMFLWRDIFRGWEKAREKLKQILELRHSKTQRLTRFGSPRIGLVELSEHLVFLRLKNNITVSVRYATQWFLLKDAGRDTCTHAYVHAHTHKHKHKHRIHFRSNIQLTDTEYVSVQTFSRQTRLSIATINWGQSEHTTKTGAAYFQVLY